MRGRRPGGSGLPEVNVILLNPILQNDSIFGARCAEISNQPLKFIEFMEWHDFSILRCCRWLDPDPLSLGFLSGDPWACFTCLGGTKVERTKKEPMVVPVCLVWLDSHPVWVGPGEEAEHRASLHPRYLRNLCACAVDRELHRRLSGPPSWTLTAVPAFPDHPCAHGPRGSCRSRRSFGSSNRLSVVAERNLGKEHRWRA